MKISEVLIKSQDTRKQVTGMYVDTRYDEQQHKRKIVGYCALGALRCEAGMYDEQGNSKYDKYSDMTDLMTKMFGLTADQIFAKYTCSDCGDVMTSLHDFIVHLNDEHEKTFLQIGTLLQGLGF